MHLPSGMQFAANPREFDRGGLPKYGADLSDEECEVEPYDSMLLDNNKQSKVSFAPTVAGGIPGQPSVAIIPSKPYSIIPVGATPSKPKPNQAGVDRMAMIRNDVRETASARASGNLTGDLGYSQGGYSKGGSDLFRPLRTTVAYDSDLDMESSDEGSM